MNGQHFILDVECSEKEKLADAALLKQVLLDLPEIVKMRRLTEPIIVQGAAHNPGLTGIVVIETSNIVLHTFTESGKFSLDIFSVKPIEEERVISYMRKNFDFKILRRKLFDRL